MVDKLEMRDSLMPQESTGSWEKEKVLHSVVAQVNKLYRQGNQISWQPTCVAPVWAQALTNSKGDETYQIKIKTSKSNGADEMREEANDIETDTDTEFAISPNLESKRTTPLFVQLYDKSSRKFIGLNFVQPSQADTFLAVIEKIVKGNIEAIPDLVQKPLGNGNSISGSSSQRSHSRSGSLCSSTPSVNEDPQQSIFSEQDFNNFTKKGFLYRKVEGTFSKAWKRFWVELKDTRLIFFKPSTLSHGGSIANRTSGSPSGSPGKRRISSPSVDANGEVTANGLNMDAGLRHNSTHMVRNCLAFPVGKEFCKRDFVFGVSFGDGNVGYLQASSDNEMKSWIRSIHLSCSRLVVGGSQAEIEGMKQETAEETLMKSLNVLTERFCHIKEYSVEDAYLQFLTSDDNESEFDTSKDFKKLKQRTLKKKDSASNVDMKTLKGTLRSGDMKVFVKEMEALNALQEKRLEDVQMQIFRCECYLSSFSSWGDDFNFPCTGDLFNSLSSTTKQCITKSGYGVTVPVIHSFIINRESGKDEILTQMSNMYNLKDGKAAESRSDVTYDQPESKTLPNSMLLEEAISVTKASHEKVRKIERASDPHINVASNDAIKTNHFPKLDKKTIRLREEDVRQNMVMKYPKSHSRSKSDGVFLSCAQEGCKNLLSTEEVHSIIDSLKAKCKEVTSLCTPSVARYKQEEKPKSLSKSEYRNRVIDEFLNTERAYIADLQYLCSVYLDPLSHDGKMDPGRVQLLLINVNEILKFHQAFIEEFEECCVAEKGGDLSDFDSTIGEAIVKNIKGFHLYSFYCEKYPKALEMVADLSKEGKSILDFIQIHKENSHLFTEREAETKCFESYFIKPVQRILKYPLLIKELLKVTTSDDSRARMSLEEASDAMGKVAEYINEMKRRGENSEIADAMFELVEGLVGFDRTKLGDLVYHGQITRHAMDISKSSTIKKNSHSKALECFLFRGGLVFCEYSPKKSSTSTTGMGYCFVDMKLQAMIPIDALLIRNREDIESIRNSWEIVDLSNSQSGLDSDLIGKTSKKMCKTGDPVTYLLLCRSPEDKARWISMIKDNIKQGILERQEKANSSRKEDSVPQTIEEPPKPLDVKGLQMTPPDTPVTASRNVN